MNEETQRQRYCAYCQKPIKKGYVCKACKEESKAGYNKEYQRAYYLKRREDYRKMREELAEYKKRAEQKNED